MWFFFFFLEKKILGNGNPIGFEPMLIESTYGRGAEAFSDFSFHHLIFKMLSK